MYINAIRCAIMHTDDLRTLIIHHWLVLIKFKAAFKCHISVLKWLTRGTIQRMLLHINNPAHAVVPINYTHLRPAHKCGNHPYLALYLRRELLHMPSSFRIYGTTRLQYLRRN